MKKLFLFLVCLVAMATTAIAQKMQEVVYLKNGSIIRGMIVEQKPNESLKIQTSDGSVFVYEMKDVDRITKEAALVQDDDDDDDDDIKYPRSGYRGFGDLTVGVSVGKADCGLDYDFSRITISTVHGAQLNKKLFVGGGLGYQEWTDNSYDTDFSAVTLALFGDVRYDILDMKCSPYADVRIGSHIGDYQGFYFRPTFGVRVKHFNAYMGFELQPTNIEYTIGKVDFQYTENFGCFVFGIAFDWGARH